MRGCFVRVKVPEDAGTLPTIKCKSVASHSGHRGSCCREIFASWNNDKALRPQDTRDAFHLKTNLFEEHLDPQDSESRRTVGERNQWSDEKWPEKASNEILVRQWYERGDGGESYH